MTTRHRQWLTRDADEIRGVREGRLRPPNLTSRQVLACLPQASSLLAIEFISTPCPPMRGCFDLISPWEPKLGLGACSGVAGLSNAFRRLQMSALCALGRASAHQPQAFNCCFSLGCPGPPASLLTVSQVACWRVWACAALSFACVSCGQGWLIGCLAGSVCHTRLFYAKWYMHTPYRVGTRRFMHCAQSTEYVPRPSHPGTPSK